VPIVQAELDDFLVYWNLRQVRSQPEKMLPSNHVPQDAVEHPEMYGGIDCLVRVPKSVVDDLRQFLAEEVGSREHFQMFYAPSFHAYASKVHRDLGAPHISLGNAWDIFSRMSDVMELESTSA